MLHSINLERLHTFVIAARAPSFAAAARQRALSVSAISQQVRALEGELGHALFERIGRRVRLTPEGRHLLEVAQTHLGAIDEAVESLGSRRTTIAGRVALGCPRTFGQHWLAPRVPPLLARAPGLQLQLTFEVPSALERRLVDGALDLAVLARMPEAPALHSELLTHETFVAVVATGTRLGTLDEAGARKLRWVVFAEDRPMHDAWWKATFGSKRSSEVAAVVEAPALEWMLELVVRGVGAAVLPDYLVDAALARREVKRVPVVARRPARSALHLAWRRGTVPTARLQAVLEAVKAPRRSEL
jgi:DNA-binding transcriptional LysR family regulator